MSPESPCTDSLSLRPDETCGVIFDCDGVLADSDATWSAAFQAVAGTYGARLAASQLKTLHGFGVRTGAQELAAWFPGAGVKDLESRLQSALRDAFAQRPATPRRDAVGLAQLLDQLAVPRAVVSNSAHDALDHTLEAIRISKYLPKRGTPNRRLMSKPAPDLYQKACRLIGPAPDACVAIEDSMTGATAAHRTGLPIIVVGLASRWPPSGPHIRQFVMRHDDPSMKAALKLPSSELGEPL